MPRCSMARGSPDAHAAALSACAMPTMPRAWLDAAAGKCASCCHRWRVQHGWRHRAAARARADWRARTMPGCWWMMRMAWACWARPAAAALELAGLDARRGAAAGGHAGQGLRQLRRLRRRLARGDRADPAARAQLHLHHGAAAGGGRRDARGAAHRAQQEGWRRERLRGADRALPQRRGAARHRRCCLRPRPSSPCCCPAPRAASAASEALRRAASGSAAIRSPTVPAGTERLRVTLSAGAQRCAGRWHCSMRCTNACRAGLPA